MGKAVRETHACPSLPPDIIISQKGGLIASWQMINVLWYAGGALTLENPNKTPRVIYSGPYWIHQNKLFFGYNVSGA